MSQEINNYELSVWSLDGQKETKLAIIGAPDMLTPARAQSPRLVRNTNGTKTLTFSLFYEYLDEIDGNYYLNPFCNLIKNETRLKLKWKEKWYEFIVKNVVEDSKLKQYSYTANDAFIEELSRKGFDIELSTVLENNQGTIIELENKILEKSDWTVDEENSIITPQTRDEILVSLKTTSQITVRERATVNFNEKLKLKKEKIIIPENSVIYTFYSTIYKKDKFFQFYYSPNGLYSFNDDGFIENCDLYSIDNYSYSGDLPTFTTDNKITTFKGKKLIRSQVTEYDKVLDKYVKIYSNNRFNKIKGYTETEYVTSDFVSNLVTNSTDFVTDVGWYGINDGVEEISAFSYPNDALSVLNTAISSETVKTYIKVMPRYVGNYLFYNTGFEDNKKILKSLYSGQKFVVRLKYKYRRPNTTSAPMEMPSNARGQVDDGFKVSLCTYDIGEDGKIVIKEKLFSTSISGDFEYSLRSVDGYWTAICSIPRSFSQTELMEENFGIFFSYEVCNYSWVNSNNLRGYEFFIEDFQLFELKENDSGGYYLLGDIISGEAKTKYYYFNADQSYKTAEEIRYLYQGFKSQNYSETYHENYKQVRTIEGKESNIYNLTQTLCETFDCWADFMVEHDDLGYIKKDSNGNFIKKICFKPYIGKDNYMGFHYKLNLDSIQRNIESKQITTKTIVKSNSNEFAPNGFCTIAYSDENPSGESFIYDFRYYESQGLINSEILSEELYGKNGLYSKLSTINKQIREKIEKRAEASLQIIHWEKEKEVLDATIDELVASVATSKKDFKLYSKMTYEAFLNLPKTGSYSQQSILLSDQYVANSFIEIFIGIQEQNKTRVSLNTATQNYNTSLNTYNTLSEELKELTQNKETLILNFETKYAPFIQEGMWISEDYIDHNLYYIDAKSVAATSANPQITYTINVLDISGIEEFKNYVMDIGDKTYITDPEFFGYVLSNGFYTPKKQEVIISEMVEELEKPENNKIVVQNYKTQFDDLFQRITAATQQLQLNNGSIQRAAGAFTNIGLNSTITQASLNGSNFVLENNTNRWDSSGIISTNVKDNREFIKIHNGSMLVTKDGGKTWEAAINGKGINANYIYGGHLDAGKINIVTELKTSENQQLEYALMMNKDGISMYSYGDSRELRLRLGKILDNSFNVDNEVYGLQLYNKDGKETLKTDSNGDITITGTIYATDGEFTGTIYANNGEFNGTIIAKNGEIGGWKINQNQLNHYQGKQIDAIITTDTLEKKYSVNDIYDNNWRLLFGIKDEKANFGINSSGTLYAYGVDIRDGNISFGDIFKITSNGEESGAVSYGLNINLTPENEDKEIVIESDSRVIGIREKHRDKDNNIVLDENGKPIWTWKTILGDLTNATLGGQSLKDLGMEGYGLCTENGFFSGTIVARQGQIGGWEILENTLKRIYETTVEDGVEKIKKSVTLGPVNEQLIEIPIIPTSLTFPSKSYDIQKQFAIGFLGDDKVVDDSREETIYNKVYRSIDGHNTSNPTGSEYYTSFSLGYFFEPNQATNQRKLYFYSPLFEGLSKVMAENTSIDYYIIIMQKDTVTDETNQVMLSPKTIRFEIKDEKKCFVIDESTRKQIEDEVGNFEEIIFVLEGTFSGETKDYTYSSGDKVPSASEVAWEVFDLPYELLRSTNTIKIAINLFLTSCAMFSKFDSFLTPALPDEYLFTIVNDEKQSFAISKEGRINRFLYLNKDKPTELSFETFGFIDNENPSEDGKYEISLLSLANYCSISGSSWNIKVALKTKKTEETETTPTFEIQDDKFEIINKTGLFLNESFSNAVEHKVVFDKKNFYSYYQILENGEIKERYSNLGTENYPWDTLFLKDGVKITGKNKILWEGCMYLFGTQSINLSEKITKQPNGIVLVWSAYVYDEALKEHVPRNIDFVYKFIPKYHIETFGSAQGGKGAGVAISDPYLGMFKYVYINDTTITGYGNDDTLNKQQGHNSSDGTVVIANAYGTNPVSTKFINTRYVLRAVIGV